ncbi:LysR family transcriptional regulator [Magnetococcus sp. PR-3]|uniref:LysR family transcriptional regulator n=1 Tax=Magnetococcus sp. PR-3 TaxID=3120355 RepID=UPI002FCE2063
MLDLMPNLRTFVTVAELERFSAAGRVLNMANSSVTRHIHQLEERLSVALLVRTTRHVRLSPAGEVFYDQAKQLLAQVEVLAQSVTQDRSVASGRLKISAPWRYGRLRIAPLLGRFMGLYPEIQVELICSDEMVNLVEEGFDVAIRLSQMKDSNLIAKKIDEQPFALVAAPAYLEDRAPIVTHQGLEGHRMLSFRYSTPHYSWQLRHDGHTYRIPIRDSALVSNNADLLTQATLDGVGIMVQPLWAIEEALQNGTLVQLLANYEVTSTTFHSGIYLLYAKENRHNPCVRAWMGFMGACLANKPE